MPVPKRKTSKGRTRRKRNSHYFRTPVQTVKCESCGESKQPHVVCSNCGSEK